MVPPAIRWALVVRDRGCRYAGCDRLVTCTDAHHIVHWADGGPTSLGNLVLLCRYHHHLVHERHHHLKLLPDATVQVTKPNGTVLTSHPRGIPHHLRL